MSDPKSPLKAKCKRRCCVVQDMKKALYKLLEKEFPNRKEYKISGTTENDEQIHIHIEHTTIHKKFLHQLEDLHYEVTRVWPQAHNAISLAVVPNEVYFK